MFIFIFMDKLIYTQHQRFIQFNDFAEVSPDIIILSTCLGFIFGVYPIVREWIIQTVFKA